MNYPLGEFEHDIISSKTGKALDDINLEAVLNGEINAEDIKISSETLLKQADIANQVNRPQLANNFERASELVNVPDSVILDIYNKIRPNRSSYEELIEIAKMLKNKYKAPNCSKLVYEAAQVYKDRGVTL